MPYLTTPGRAVEFTRQASAQRISWSEMACEIGVELRYDPPVEDGDYLHDAQREELHRVLAAYNDPARVLDEGAALAPGQENRPMAEPKTHDYRNAVRRWGHDITYRPAPNDQLKALGWGRGIADGDYLLLSNGKGDTRYRVDLITYYRDPPDMWKAVLSFAPRTTSS